MSSLPETEVETITLTIDGREVSVAPGTTVLEAARSIGIEIPTLCHDPRLEPFGACRLCLVEVEGGRGPMPSCALKCTDGMVVHTQTERIRKLRKFVIELLVSYHPLDCPVCEAAGDCRLQDYAYEYGVAVSPWGWHPLDFPTRDDHPNIARNPNRCILCGRCVRICREVMAIGCWGFRNRGYDTIIDTPYNMPLEEVGCVSCGQCVSTCPVGALNMKRSRYAARNWQTNKTITTCAYCAVGCEQEVQTFRGKFVRVKARVGEGVNKGNLCVKGRFGMEYVNSEERLVSPLVRGDDGLLRPATWEEAINRAAEGLKKAKGPQTVGIIASARCTNEENYLLQKLARTVLGTNNIDNGARYNHAAAVATLKPMLGYAAMTNSIGDLAQADVILVAGSNTTEEHPVLGLELIKALRAEKQLIVVDPRCTDLAKKATLHLAVKPGSDAALFAAMLKHIVDAGLVDEEFVAERTQGYEDLLASLESVDLERAAETCGIRPEDIRAAAELYAKAGAASILFSAGLTQQRFGAAAITALVDLALVCGNFGRPGTGINCLAGPANAQGACDMGCLPDFLPGLRSLSDGEAVRAVEAAMGARMSDTTPGKTISEMLAAAAAGSLSALYIVGENPAVSEPDQPKVREALEKVGFLVVQDIFLSETARYADVVLPAGSVLERDGTFTSTERRIQRVRKAMEPYEDTKPDWQIVQLLANALGAGWSYDSPQAVMAEIAKVVPEYAGITYERLETGGVQWPCPAGDHPGTPILYQDGFPGGKATFLPVMAVATSFAEDGYRFLLITGIEREHFGTGVRSRRAPGLSGLVAKARLQINPADAAQLGVQSGDNLGVKNANGFVSVEALVSSTVPAGIVFMAQHYAEAPAAALFASEADETTKVPSIKAVPVNVEKA